MSWIVLMGLLGMLMLLPSWAEAQAAPTVMVDYHTSTIAWDWVRGAPPNDGIATKFRVKCGPTKGQYTHPIKEVPMPQKSIKIGDAVPVQGEAACVVVAANNYGESKVSNEVFFDAGAIPTTPTNIRIE